MRNLKYRPSVIRDKTYPLREVLLDILSSLNSINHLINTKIG